MLSPTLNEDSDYTHDPATNTLTILESTGYASALAASVPLDTITTLRDYSNDSPYLDEHRPTPTTFPLPALQHAHFIGLASEPPRFPLPANCKLYARLGRTDPWDEGEDIETEQTLEIAFPWLAHPQIEVLHLSMLGATWKTLPESGVKHLLLSEGNCFMGGVELPRGLETFVLEHHPFEGFGWASYIKWDLRTLVRGLPRSLKTLGLDVSTYDLEDKGANSALDLRELESLRTLCLPWYLLPEEIATTLPEGVENLAVSLFGWNHGSDPGDQMLRIVELRTNLKRLLISGGEAVKLDKEKLQKACTEKGVVLTYSGFGPAYCYPGNPDDIDSAHLYWKEECGEDRRALFLFRKEPF